MNFRIRVLALLLFLQFKETFSADEFFATKLNRISSLNKVPKLSHNVTLNHTVNQNIYSSSNKSILKLNNKWKVERVTNKQFGIINILWQKTKIFVDEDYSNFTCKATTVEMTPAIQKQLAFEKGASKLSAYQRKNQASTPSYIEFYYLDQADDRVKRKHPSNSKLQKAKKGNKTSVSRSNNKKSSIPTLFKIHINTVRRKSSSPPTKTVYRVGQGNVYRNRLNKSRRPTVVSKGPLMVTTKAKIRTRKQQNKLRSQQHVNVFTRTTRANYKTSHEKNMFKGKNNSYSTEVVIDRSYLVPESTSIAYDKVKFFEMYDNNTPKLQIYVNNNVTKNVSFAKNSTEKKNVDDEKILLHHVNENIGHHQDGNKTRYVKKHIQDLYTKEEKLKNGINITNYFSKHDSTLSTKTFQSQDPSRLNSSWNQPIPWTEFPFVAVYIYEPSQVRCDAAGISPHWLVAAASCLSRHNKGFREGGLSAFVTFCADNWRYPQMISYVKRTLIHPLHHPKDRLRRLFNAGLIQVVNSMADTCSGWAPASLMSHQFTADEKGSIGTAIGWGLDRYDDSYTTTNIPTHPLMLYEGRVYSQTCPGSSEYSRIKGSYEVDVRNVYCLLLPPYVAEENDTVHGALLLIGGKLLALYLKEERRPWGMQSAEYTGIWRLLPWLAETAREPDESFQFEI